MQMKEDGENENKKLIYIHMLSQSPFRSLCLVLSTLASIILSVSILTVISVSVLFTGQLDEKRSSMCDCERENTTKHERTKNG